MNKQLNTGLLFSLVTVCITVSFQFFFIRYASYNIEKNDYGNFVLLLTLVAGLSAIFLQIPRQAYDRFYNEATNKLEFINQFRFFLIIINIISVLMIYFYGIFTDRYTIILLGLIAILFILLNTYNFNQKIFLLNMERKKYFYLRIFDAIARFITPAISYYIYRSVESLVIGMIIGYLIAVIYLFVSMKEYPYRIVFLAKNVKKYFVYAYPIIFVSLATWGISFSDRYFIDYYIDTESVAIYALLAMVAGVGQIIGQIYFMYAEPKILKLFENNYKATFNLIKKYLIILSFLFFLLIVIAILLPSSFYSILLEKTIINDSYYFSTMIVLLMSIFLNVLHIAHHMYIKLMKRLDVLAYIYIIALFVNIIGNLFIQSYGIIAAAISTLIAYVVILFGQIIFVQKNLKKFIIKLDNDGDKL